MSNRAVKTKPKVVSRKLAPRRWRELVAAPSTGIVKAVPVAAIVQQSTISTITDTVKNMERMRRFVSKCLNIDLTRELAKLDREVGLNPDQKSKKEIDLRNRLEIDWGTIPGVDKPFLKQPGAEKVCFWLGIRPQYHKTTIALHEGHIEVVAYVTLHSRKTGEEVFEGPEASCTTMEDNYRFRYTERDPQEPKPSPEEGQRLKRMGLGRWRQKDIWVRGKKTGTEWVWYDRTDNPNIWNERNKVRQIGEKRALVKAVRGMGALSEIFVSDPSEWELPAEVEDREGSPVLDAQFTQGGRRIVPATPPEYTPSEQQFLDRLTPEQREVEKAQIKKLRQKDSPSHSQTGDPTAKSGSVRTEVAPQNRNSDSGAPAFLSYEWLEGSKKFEITGPDALKTQAKEVLAPLYDRAAKTILATPDELGKLLSHLEQIPVPIRAKVTREPGED